MKFKLPVRRSAYKTLSQPELAGFALNVSKRMSTNPDYAGIATEAGAMGELATQFTTAIDEALDRSIHHIVNKNRLYKQVIEALDRIVDWMVFHYTGDELWVINAGFPVSKPAERISTELSAPFALSYAKLSPNEILVSFKVAQPKQVRTNVLEFSPNNGESWVDGYFGNSKGIQISNLPIRQDLLVRLHSVGAESKKSPWSEPMKVFLSGTMD